MLSLSNFDLLAITRPNESSHKFVTAVHHRPDTAVRGVVRIQFLSDLTDNIGDGGITITIRFLPDRLIDLLFAEHPARVFCQVAESEKLIVAHGNENASFVDSLLSYMNLQIREGQHLRFRTVALLRIMGQVYNLNTHSVR